MEVGSIHRISGYEIKFVGDSIDPDDGVGAFFYEISWMGGDVKWRIAATDAGISIKSTDEHWNKIYREKGWHRQIWDYTDTMRAVHFALGAALEEKNRRRVLGSMAHQTQERIEQWIRETCPGAKPMDLGRDATRDFILSCEWRRGEDWGVDVLYRDRWLRLGHTDLCDDVRTSVSSATYDDPSHINFWRRGVSNCFGARLSETDFSIVDRISDG